MKTTSISIDIPAEIMLALNENEQELKNHFQANIAALLFQEGKLTIGKAIQLSRLSRYEFEKILAKKHIPLSNPSVKQVFADLDKLND